MAAVFISMYENQWENHQMTEIEDVRRQMDSANQDSYDIGYGDGKAMGWAQGFATAAFTSLAALFVYMIYTDWDNIMGMLR
jgi:hypothetical protein